MVSLNDFWLPIRDKYRAAHGRKTYFPREVVAWALKTGEWSPDDATMIGAGVDQLKRAVKHDLDQKTGLPQDINFDDPQGRLWVNWRQADWAQRQQFLNLLGLNVERATRKANAYHALFNANRKKGEPEHQLRFDFGQEDVA